MWMIPAYLTVTILLLFMLALADIDNGEYSVANRMQHWRYIRHHGSGSFEDKKRERDEAIGLVKAILYYAQAFVWPLAIPFWICYGIFQAIRLVFDISKSIRGK